MKTILKRTFCLIFSLILLFISSAAAQKDLSTAKQHIKELIAEDYLLGVSAAYIQPDGDVQYFSPGSISTDRNVKPAKNTVYEIGSISKTFTSLILARMVQQGIVSLQTPIDAILPDSIHIEPYDSTKITLLHLATHTSGLPRLPANFTPADQKNPYAGYTIQQLYEFLDNYKISRKPGSKVAYSNLGVGLLGHLLALKSGVSYEHLLRYYITEPLGMNDTGIDVPESKAARFAMPYASGTATGRWRLPPAFVAAGGIRSTVSDMTTYLKAQMGFIETEFDSAIALTHKIYFNEGVNNLDATALAWFYAAQHDTLIIHGGATGGYRAFAGWNIEDQTGAVVLSSGVFSVSDLGLHLLDQRYELNEIKQAIELEPAQLAAYVGAYKAPTAYFYVTQQKDQLWVKLGAQKVRVYPESPSRFYYKQINAEIEFHKDSTGVVTGLTFYQNRVELKAEKVSDSIKINERETVKIHPDSLQRYEGVYQITPLFSITVFQKGGHLMAQPTGQQAFQIYAESKTRFFLKAAPAEIEFIKNEKGEITKLKLYQGGRVLTGVKVEKAD